MTKAAALKPESAPQIGRYHRIAELARGGMGNVYLALSQGPGNFSKLLAMKELKPELCDDKSYVTMFLEEATLAARLTHPNIVQTNEVGSDGARHYMVMEYLDGRSLHRIGKRLGERWPAGAHLRVIAEALLGLHYAHELRGFDGKALGIVHRDMSPLNVFVTVNGQAKVLDFGIAKTVDSSVDTKAGVLKGRVAYMSPEQARGEKVDRRADIYSVGVMLWEAAAGRRMWPQLSEAEILARVLRERVPSLRSVRPDAPEELDGICARATSARPEDRYATAADLLRDLEAHLVRRNDAMTMRGIGALVSKAFCEERRAMTEVIEEATTRLRRGIISGIVPAFRPSLAAGPTGASHPAGDSKAAFGSPPTPSNGFGLHGGSSQAATTKSLGPLVAEAPESAPPARRAITLALGTAALLLCAFFLGTTWHRAKPRTENATAPAYAMAHAPVLAASSREAPRTSHVVVTALPAVAQVYVDDVPVANPFVADAIQDTTQHHLRVEAPGYQNKVRTLDFADDVDLRVALEPVRAAQSPRRTAPPRADTSPNCQPPYVVDLATGAKHWRLECL